MDRMARVLKKTKDESPEKYLVRLREEVEDLELKNSVKNESDEISGKPSEIEMQRHQKTDQQGCQPGGQYPPVKDHPILFRSVLLEAQFWKNPYFGGNHGTNGHEDQSVDGYIIQQLHEKDRKTG